MAVPEDIILNQWATQWRQRKIGKYLAACLEALEPFAPAGAALLQGGRWLFVPWIDDKKLRAIALLLEDHERRSRFLQR